MSLMRDTDARVPAAERQKPEVQKLSALIGGSCSDASIRTVPGMFTEATRLTMQHGSGFGIAPGVVNFPIDIVVIPKSGKIEVLRIPSW